MADFDLIIFDCDGVLIDSEILSCGALRAQLQEHGIDLTLPEIMQRFLGRSLSEVERYYHDRLGRSLPADFAPALRDRMRQAFSESLLAIPHVDVLLQNLRGNFCLASSSDPDRVNFSLNLSGLSPYFEGRVFTASMVARGKPAPDLFLLAAASMKAGPARSLVIEDSVSGVEAGKAAGMTVWGFVGGSHYDGRDGHGLLARAGADRVFDRMTELEDALGQMSRVAS